MPPPRNPAAGAPAAIREAQPDAVLLDQRDWDIRRLSTVVCAAHPLAGRGQEPRLWEQGCVALAKPIDLVQLLAAVEAAACRGLAVIMLAPPQERRARQGDGRCESSC